MSTSGDALMNSSATPLTLATGAMKNAWNAASGSLPSAANSTSPVSSVSAAAISGDA